MVPVSKPFDVAILGGGPGGYVAAIKAAALGLTVVLIENQSVGGTCLHRGCIPTKALVASASTLRTVQRADLFGIHVENISWDYKKMHERTNSIVMGIHESLKGLLASYKNITIIHGFGSFISPREIKIQKNQGSGEIISAKSIIIATGSSPVDLPFAPCDHKKIFNSTSILTISKLPKSMVIIGGGYIGCEFANLFTLLGVKITLVEAAHSIISQQGKVLSTALADAMQKHGTQILTNAVVQSITPHGRQVVTTLTNGEKITTDIALVAVGRSVNTKGLGLQSIALPVHDRGYIDTNDKMETNVPGVFAIGDVTGKSMLAHVASHQGMIAAINISGTEAIMHYNAIPSIIFTHPEIAMVGLTEEQAIANGLAVVTGKFPFGALGKSHAISETEGFSLIVADAKTKQILGAQIIGYSASSLIAEMTVAIANELTLECIADTIHAHPTLPEATFEASLVALGMPLHLPQKKRA